MADDGLDWVREEAAKSMGSSRPLSDNRDIKAQIAEEEAKSKKVFWGTIAAVFALIIAKLSKTLMAYWIFQNKVKALGSLVIIGQNLFG